jgi:4-hydroxy-tetrahydrodipicolinate reductase
MNQEREGLSAPGIPPIPVSIHGAAGRMGRLVTELVESTDGLRLAALVDRPEHAVPAGRLHPRLPLVGQQSLAEVHPRGGVIVDFSLAGGLSGLLEAGAATAAPLVIGTTGHDPRQRDQIARYAAAHAVVLAANFSVGIPLLKLLLELVARMLPGGFDAGQVEIHHHHKVDRPSGTARWLAAAWQEARGEDPEVRSLRLGGVTGEHGWIFSDDEETLQIVHRAHSRRAFLRGIVPAIRFVSERDSGLYGLEDVLAAGGGPDDRNPAGAAG